MNDPIKVANAVRIGVWVATLLGLGGAVAFMMFAEYGQYYEVIPYVIWEGGATLAMVILAWIWLFLTTCTFGWVVTHTFLASLLFVGISWGISFGFWAICPVIYTPDGRNFMPLNTVLILSAAFTGLMYAFPSLQVEAGILPGGGVGQIVVRYLIAFFMLVSIAYLFWYNF